MARKLQQFNFLTVTSLKYFDFIPTMFNFDAKEINNQLKKKYKIKRHKGMSEQAIAEQHLKDFDYTKSRAYEMVQHITNNPSRHVLLLIAQILSGLTGIKFKRDFQRKSDLIYMYIDDCYDIFCPFASVLSVTLANCGEDET